MRPVVAICLLAVWAALGACERVGPPPPLRVEDPGQDWITVFSADSSLSFALPPRWQQPREGSGCAVAQGDVAIPDWRTVCVDRDSERSSVRGTSGWWPGPDGITIRAYPPDVFPRRGKPALVERALVSGGAEGAHNRRTIAVSIELGVDDWAVLRGTALEDAGYAELLSIAQTIQPTRSSRPAAEHSDAADVRPGIPAD